MNQFVPQQPLRDPMEGQARPMGLACVYEPPRSRDGQARPMGDGPGATALAPLLRHAAQELLQDSESELCTWLRKAPFKAARGLLAAPHPSQP